MNSEFFKLFNFSENIQKVINSSNYFTDSDWSIDWYSKSPIFNIKQETERLNLVYKRLQK